MGRSAHARHPFRTEGALERNRRGCAVGRHESLGERDDARVGGHALPRELADRGLDPGRRDGDEHQVRAVELVVAPAERPNLEPVGQPDAGQVALVLVRGGKPLGLLRRAAQERGAQARALEHERDRRAEGSGPDHRRAARLLSARPSDAGRLVPSR